MKLYVEVRADGTVPVEVRVLRTRPSTLPEGQEYARWDAEDGTGEGDWLRVFEVDATLDEGSETGIMAGKWVELYVTVAWSDDEGYTVAVFDDVFPAIEWCAEGAEGFEFEYQHKDEPKMRERNLCWYREADNDGNDVFIHLYRRFAG